jgi:vacuolar protein sorting-associated protein 35
VHDALEFVITNFGETNRLWVRMQSGSKADKKKREKERNDLRILVGTNLVRLSQLEGVDVETFKEQVLPKVLEQVVNCKDTIAQTYLMDCVVHVFPEEFHLATLEAFLATCTQLKEKVSVRTILESMMDRLANGSGSSSDGGGGQVGG